MRLLSLLTVVALLISALSPAFAQKPSRDDQIYDQVRRKLAADRDVKGGGIEVEVKDGVVTLRGKVREERQKTKAEHLAKKVKGVKRVINGLQVGISPEPPAETAKPAE
jgi:osmotically-inducible protein OsmY